MYAMTEELLLQWMPWQENFCYNVCHHMHNSDTFSVSRSRKISQKRKRENNECGRTVREFATLSSSGAYQSLVSEKQNQTFMNHCWYFCKNAGGGGEEENENINKTRERSKCENTQDITLALLYSNTMKMNENSWNNVYLKVV